MQRRKIKYFFFLGSVVSVFLLLTACNQAKQNQTIQGYDPQFPGILPTDACGVWAWYSTGGSPNKWNGKVKPEDTYPEMKGIPIVVGWNELEPKEGVYNWDLVDEIIKIAAENNKYVFTLLWLNPVNAEWLYEKGVPKVEINTFKTDPHFATLPYPFDEQYKFYSERIITKLAQHLRNLPPELFKHVLFHQVVEGSTGDGFCYKGEPKDPKYAVSRDEWAVYQEYIRKFTIEAFTGDYNNKPPVTVLLHTRDLLWAADQYKGFVTKKGVASHFYHSNSTRSIQQIYESFNTPDNPLGRPVYSRGEGETMWMTSKQWFQKDSLRNLYWSALYAIHCGLDIWNIPDHLLAQPRWHMALDVFDKYAGHKYPDRSPVAFSALKDELNVDDTARFPESVYGLLSKSSLDRTEKILQEFARQGALLEDPEMVMAGSHQSRSRKGYNDAGWDRIDNGYNLYLYPVDAVETSIGWWHIGPKESPYGRFARGFEHKSGKDTLFFRFHEDFFPGIDQSRGKLTFRIIWLDNSKGSWKFVYDAVAPELKTAKTFSGSGSGTWKEEVFSVNDAAMNTNGPRGSDLALINTDSSDEIFHLIELERRTR